jgi:hypothetical protein
MVYEHEFKRDLLRICRETNILSGVAYINNEGEVASSLKNVVGILTKIANTSKIENEHYNSDNAIPDEDE